MNNVFDMEGPTNVQTNAYTRSSAVLRLFTITLTCGPVFCQTPEIQRTARTQTAESRPVINAAGELVAAETPVVKVLRWGDVMLARTDRIADYSCTFVKRERISGQLSGQQVAVAHVRHQPFSVSLKFQAPSSMAGKAAVWVHGKNNGKMLASGNGLQSVLGTVSLDPNGYFAMQDNLHPITDIGIRNLLQQMITTTKHDSQHGEIEIQFRRGAKVADRRCTCIQFDHPLPRRGLRYRMSRIYVDDQLDLPIRFEGYTWPRIPGGAPVLIEEYTYMKLKLNKGLTDSDFRL